MNWTYKEKKIASEGEFHRAKARPTDETTPREITSDVESLVARLGAEQARYVPVVHDQYGLFGWCVDGVREKIEHEGGSICFGWALWEWSLAMLTAEFHAVWIDPLGALADITPKPHGETSILFVPDPTYPADFDFDKRPRNRRARIYKPRDPFELVEGMIARLKPAQHQYELVRAQKSGLTLTEWMRRKVPNDPLPKLIDEFIESCERHEAKSDQLGAAGLVQVDQEFMLLHNQRATLCQRVKQALWRIQRPER